MAVDAPVSNYTETTAPTQFVLLWTDDDLLRRLVGDDDDDGDCVEGTCGHATLCRLDRFSGRSSPRARHTHVVVVVVVAVVPYVVGIISAATPLSNIRQVPSATSAHPARGLSSAAEPAAASTWRRVVDVATTSWRHRLLRSPQRWWWRQRFLRSVLRCCLWTRYEVCRSRSQL